MNGVEPSRRAPAEVEGGRGAVSSGGSGQRKRYDIQALRAVAVLLVVVYHLWPKRLPGGFIGVDVFFVISGYLITAHLVGEVARTGTVSLTRFWARRVRRLLPAAFLVLLFSVALAVMVMPESLLQQNLAEIGAAGVYALNWVLAVNSVDYLAADNTPSLVQHYWSLSVEEQFYIVWPLVVLAAIWIAARRRANTRQYVLGAFVVVFVVSFIASVWETHWSPSSAYFVTYTRAWEFAAGGIAAMLPAGVLSRVRGVAGDLVSWFALALIVGAAFLYSDQTPFPGWTALLPVLGAVGLLLMGERESRWSPQYFGKVGPVQFIGDTSYAIYLWHWPLIVAIPVLLDRKINGILGVGILLASIALAWVTQKVVEDPFRASWGLLATRRASYGFMTVGMAVVVGACSTFSVAMRTDEQKIEAAIADPSGCFGFYALQNDCDDPYAVTDTVSPALSVDDFPGSYQAIDSSTCMATPLMDGRVCELGEISVPSATLALVGDSHSEHLLPPLLDLAEKNHWKILVYLKSSCSMVERARVIERADKQAQHDDCIRFGENSRSEVLANDEIDLVLLSSSERANRINVTDAVLSLEYMQSDEIPVAVVSDTVGLPDGVRAPRCVEAAVRDGVAADPCAVERPTGRGPMTQAAEKLGVPVIDLEDELCRSGKCHAVVGGTIVFHDRAHLAVSFSRTLAPWFEKEIRGLGIH